jgi:hypothetical protein
MEVLREWVGGWVGWCARGWDRELHAMLVGIVVANAVSGLCCVLCVGWTILTSWLCCGVGVSLGWEMVEGWGRIGRTCGNR